MTATLLRPANALGSISVIDPATPLKRREGSDKRGPAARSASLDGKVLAIIDNQMGSAPILADALLARLKDDYRLADVIWVKKPSVSVPPRPEDWAKVTSSADVGLALFGGCGSCTSRAVRDAIEMEWSGIPSVAIVHDALMGSANAIRKMSGMADYPVVTVGYPAAPTSVWTGEQLDTVVETIYSQVVERLTSITAAQ